MWPTTPPDHLLNFVLGGAAVLTILGVTVGGWFGLRYGRRASVSLTATVDEREGGCLVVIRPSIKAVGILRVKFKKGAAGFSGRHRGVKAPGDRTDSNGNDSRSAGSLRGFVS